MFDRDGDTGVQAVFPGLEMATGGNKQEGSSRNWE